MTAFSDGPCAPWDPIWSCELPVSSTPTVTGYAVQAATELLWALSGRRYGTCQVTLRPCRRDCSGGSEWPLGTSYPRPIYLNGQWLNLVCGGCETECSCSVVEEVLLPGPVASIVEVKVDGAVLVTSAYRVDNYRLLVRTDGESWPLCNDLNEADTEVGTWSVTALFGEAVPTLGRMAVGELALELTKALLCDDGCLLPKPIQQISRQGVSLTFLDPNEAFTDGRIGLYMSDLFISTVNPDRLRSRSQVFDVDASSPRIAGT